MIYKVTNYNAPHDSGMRTTQSIVRADQIEAHDHMWGAVYPAQLMDWKIRRRIRVFTMAVPNVDYSKYALQPGQPCTCNKHQLLDRQGNPIDPEIAADVMSKELSLIACENGVYWNCESCACTDDPQRHV